MADKSQNKSAEQKDGGSAVRIEAIREAVAAPDEETAASEVTEAKAEASPASSPSGSKAISPKGRAPKAKAARKIAAAKPHRIEKTPASANTRKNNSGRKTDAKNRTIDELKETIMATKAESKVNTTDFAAGMQNFSAEMQDRMKAAYEKSSSITGELTETARGNVEAVVESSRIFATGVQSMSRDAVEGSREAFEGMTADLKKMAAVKSPTELFQLQGELARRNFDAMIGLSSRNTENMVKLVNDAFAPISNRMSVTAEKISQAA